jgi:hypothetical protein
VRVDEGQTRRRLEAAIGADPAAIGADPAAIGADPAAIGGDLAVEVYPEPVEHCAICRWRDLCRERRRADDDLSLVAGMTTGQRRALKSNGISTRRGFAGLAGLPRLDRVSPGALGRARRQARLQVASEDDGIIRYELLDPERDADGALVANRGLLALPEPAHGDLFFDIEGGPLLLGGRPGVRAPVPVRRRRRGRGRRGGTPQVHADLGLRPAPREEAPAVIYSTATSSADEAARGRAASRAGLTVARGSGAGAELQRLPGLHQALQA